MGIQGLLPLLKECQTPTHIREYKGQTLAIDAYVWLHRGAYGCAQEIATGQQTTKYVKYAMHRIRLLKHFGIVPYVVFDGGLLPSKMGTENDRDSRREEALAKAQALSREGQYALAREFFAKAVDITPQMAYQLIKVLKAENVAYIVAPYEADAQLAYLEKKGIVDGIITEDSDLLVFGCRKVLFKMDSEGACVEIRRDHFTKCREFSFSGWSDTEFRQMAILSGCDYLDNIQGLGIKKSHQLMRKYKTIDKVVKFLRLDGQYKIPLGYAQACRRAELTFMHQRVFCPEERKLVHLEPLPEHLVAASGSLEEALRFVGPDMDDETALGIALGELCPISKAKMVDIAPGLDVLAQIPASAAVQTGKTASIKDWFKPDPSAGSARKKPVKRESTVAPNSVSTSTPLGPIAQVKSRFFGSAVAGPSSLRKISVKLETPQAVTDSVDLTLESEDESCDRFEKATARASGHLDGIPSPGGAAIQTTPPKSVILSPKRPSTARQPLSESGFSHISSPTSSSPGGKGKGRECLEDSGFGGDSMDLVNESRIEDTEMVEAQMDVDVFDLTSPEVIVSKRKPIVVPQPGSQGPSGRKRKREQSDTIAWSSDPVEPSPEANASPAQGATSLERHSSLIPASPPPKRRNATLPKRGKVKAEPDQDSGVFERCSPEEKAAQESVVRSWREKFSSSSSLARRSSSIALSITSSNKKSSRHSSAKPAPRLSSERSFLDLSCAPRQQTKKVVGRASVEKLDRDEREDIDDEPTSADMLSSTSEQSASTSRSLESFRFRPSQVA